MTYEFVKHVADNLRFGSYEGKCSIRGYEITIKDIDKNLFFKITPTINWITLKSPTKWWERKKTERMKLVSVIVETGVLSTNEKVGYYQSDAMDNTHSDFKFWDEFFTWTKSKWEDKVYKHNCLIEDAFVL